jgi:hypothetical protein
VQTVKTSKLCYHHLFETFQNDVLLLDANMGAIPNANNPNGLLAFSKLNKNPFQDLAMLSTEQQVTSEDRLFLFNFDPNPTEKPEDINLPGIDELPAIIDDQVQRIRSRKDAVERRLKFQDIAVEKAKSGQLEHVDGSRLVTVEEVKAAFIRLR